jgi:protoheme IX farnesyltransferase
MTGEREARAPRLAAVARDLVALTKPRITAMVVLTAGIGLLLASSVAPEPVTALHLLLGTWLVAAGSSALNHLLERDRDARMRRTADRPLPAGRLRPRTALAVGAGLSGAGTLELAWGVGIVPAALGLVAFTAYVAVYTPLKLKSSLATLVGAVPGAIPPMMGWSAVTGRVDLGAWILFLLLFLWQLPHFLAIAWICREDYARAGFPMLPVLHPDGRSTARQMVLYSAALLPVSVGPTALGLTGWPYFAGTLALGLGFLACCWGFGRTLSERAARRVLVASVVYLPAVLGVMVIDRVA